MLGIALAVAQQDLKRLLAYSSIENVGIIVIGVGLASIGRSLGRADLVVLGLGGALLHVLNHSLFKPLLFLAAGSVLHATGTRQDLVARRAWRARCRTRSCCSRIGAVAICGLPPLNGFASELLLYVGLLRAAGRRSGARLGLGGPRGARSRDDRSARGGGLRQGHGHRLQRHASQPGRCTGPRSRRGGMLAPMVALALAPASCSACCRASRCPSCSAPSRPGIRCSAHAAPPLGELAPLGWVIARRALLLIAARRARRGALRPAAPGARQRAHLGLRLRAPHAAHAVRRRVVLRDAGRPLRLGRAIAPVAARAAGSVSAGSRASESEVPDAVLDHVVLPLAGRRRIAASRSCARSSGAPCRCTCCTCSSPS